MANLIPDETMQEIADYLLGTCKSEHEAVAAFELSASSEEELLSRINDYEVERCDGCGWWLETSELDEESLCEDCRNE